MLLATDFAQLNTWILGGVGLITAGGVVYTGFNSASVREANILLKTEMEASNARADRLEKERDDYREKLHTSAGELHACQIENTELKVRTDFTPVLDFNRKWYAEQAEVSKQTLSVLAQTAAVLARAVEALNRIEPKLQ